MAVTQQTYLTAQHLIDVNRAGPSEPDTVISGALEAAVCLIEDYASGAPDEMKREAGVRLASWLLEARAAAACNPGILLPKAARSERAALKAYCIPGM